MAAPGAQEHAEDVADPLTLLLFAGALAVLLPAAAVWNWIRLRRLLRADPGDPASRPARAERERIRLVVPPQVAFGLSLAAPLLASRRPVWTTPLEVLVAVCGGLVCAAVGILFASRMATHLGARGSVRGIFGILVYLIALPALPLVTGLLLAISAAGLFARRGVFVSDVVPLAALAAAFLLLFRGHALLRPLLGSGDAPLPDGLREKVDAFVKEGSPPPIRVWGSEADGVPPFAFAIAPRRRKPVAVLTPALLPLLSPEGLAAIVQHEVGHVALKHLRARARAALLGFAVVAAGLAAAGWANAATWATAWVLSVLYAVPPFARRQETAADLYAADHMGASAPVKAALATLGASLLIDSEKPRASATEGHPSLRERFAALDRWPADRTLPRAWPGFLLGLAESAGVACGVASLTVPPAAARLDPRFGWIGIPVALLLSAVSRSVARRVCHAPGGVGPDS